MVQRFSPNGLNNVKSRKYTPVSVVAIAGCPGYGLSNNRIVGSPDNQIPVDVSQNKGIVNGDLQYIAGRYIDTNSQDNDMTVIVNVIYSKTSTKLDSLNV